MGGFFIANPACCCCWPLADGEGPLAAAVVSVEGRLGLPAEVDSFALGGDGLIAMLEKFVQQTKFIPVCEFGKTENFNYAQKLYR